MRCIARRARGRSNGMVSLTAPLGPPGSYLMLCIALVLLASLTSGDDPAMTIASRVTSEGAQALSSGDVEALVDSYTDGGEVISYLAGKDSSAIDVQSKHGTEAIRKLYGQLESDKPFSATNRVDYARLLNPDLLVAAGTLTLRSGDANELQIPFVQYRAKTEADRWQVVLMQIFLPSESDADEDAKAEADRLTSESASVFNSGDAAAMAALFAPEATVGLSTTGPDGTKPAGKVSRGRDEIEVFYRQVFEGPNQVQGQNTVDYARFIRPDLLILTGRFAMTADGKPLPPVTFTEVYRKTGDTWKAFDLRAFLTQPE